jgi:hypothetical protein
MVIELRFMRLTSAYAFNVWDILRDRQVLNLDFGGYGDLLRQSRAYQTQRASLWPERTRNIGQQTIPSLFHRAQAATPAHELLQDNFAVALHGFAPLPGSLRRSAKNAGRAAHATPL